MKYKGFKMNIILLLMIYNKEINKLNNRVISYMKLFKRLIKLKTNLMIQERKRKKSLFKRIKYLKTLKIFPKS